MISAFHPLERLRANRLSSGAVFGSILRIGRTTVMAAASASISN